MLKLSVNSRSKSSMFTKLRLGTLKLEIETGRWTKKDKDQRFWKLCSSNKIENECHFLFDCPALSSTRDLLLKEVFTCCPKLFPHWSSEEKFTFLFFNDNLDNTIVEYAGTFLRELFAAREKLLNNIR